jgi:transposase
MQYSIGLDIDKVSFKACLKAKEGDNRSVVKATRTFSANPQGFEEFDLWIKKHRKSSDSSVKIVMESTGVYHEHLAWYLHKRSYVTHIIVPLRAKRYMQSLGQKSKNDKIDAAGLADLGMQQELEPWVPCSEDILMLRSVTRQVEMLQETKTSLNNQLHAAEFLAVCDAIVIENYRSLIKTIENDITKLKSRIDQLVAEDSLLSEKYKLVQNIKGLGVLTFATIIAETGGFELFESQKQLVSYSGYDVIENQSGARVGKTRISKQGNKHIRRILHMASLNLVRYEVEPFSNLYNRVFDRTKIKMKGYVAVQRKLLCMIYALWKKDQVFDPHHRINKTTVISDLSISSITG